MQTTKIPTRLNLTLDSDFIEILLILKNKYPLLKETDLIKMAVSGYYTDHIDEFVEFIDDDFKGVEKSRQQIKDGDFETLETPEDVRKMLEG
jgi:hypothetical protein